MLRVLFEGVGAAAARADSPSVRARLERIMVGGYYITAII